MYKATEYLKSTRESKNYSIEEVSKKTKISPSVLRALEDGRLQNIDSVYLKGFLKLYCRFLGVDWDVFIKEHSGEIFGKEKIKKRLQPEPAAENKPDSVRLPAVFNWKTLSAVFLKYRQAITVVLSALAALLLIMLLFRGCMFIVKKIPKAGSVKPQTAAAASGAQAKRSSASLETKLKDTSAKSSQPSVKDRDSKYSKLVIHARENSYLRVVVDGRQLYQSVLPKGKTGVWTANKKIELSIGNVGALDVELNGKIILPLGRNRQAIKKMVIIGDEFKIY